MLWGERRASLSPWSRRRWLDAQPIARWPRTQSQNRRKLHSVQAKLGSGGTPEVTTGGGISSCSTWYRRRCFGDTPGSPIVSGRRIRCAATSHSDDNRLFLPLPLCSSPSQVEQVRKEMLEFSRPQEPCSPVRSVAPCPRCQVVVVAGDARVARFPPYPTPLQVRCWSLA